MKVVVFLQCSNPTQSRLRLCVSKANLNFGTIVAVSIDNIHTFPIVHTKKHAMSTAYV